MGKGLFGPARLVKGATLPLVILVAAVGFLPFATAARDSFFHDVWGSRSWAGLENYRLLSSDRAFVLSLGITILWACLSTLFSILIGFALACELSEARKGFKVIFAALLVPWGIPAFIAVPIWRMIIHGSGGRSILSSLVGAEINLLTDPVAGFIAALAVDVWLGVPIVVFAVYASLRKQTRSVLEAARLDGAHGWTIDRFIRFPEAKATLVVMAALGFIKSFKEFSIPFLMTAGGPPFRAGITERHIVGATTTLEIFLYDAFRTQDDYGIPSAYAVVVGLVVIALVTLWFTIGKRIPAAMAERATSVSPAGSFANAAWKALRKLCALMTIISALAVLYVVLWLSFSDLSAVYVDGVLPRFLSLRPYVQALRDEGVLRYFLNTFLVAAATSLLVPVFMLPAAWLLSRAKPAVSARIFGLVEALGMTGGIHSLIPLYVMFRLIGLLDGFVPVVAVYLFHALPFSLFSMGAFIRRLPRSLEETAALEGMRPLDYVVKVLAPLAAPAVAAAMMAAFLSAWNGFLVPLVFLNDDRLYTIGVKLHSYVGSLASGNPRWNLFAATSVINMALIGFLLFRFKSPLKQDDSSDVDDI